MSRKTSICQPICCNNPNLQVNLLERIDHFITSIDSNWNYITPPELYQKLQTKEHSKLFLLDIRKKEDYLKTGHIPGSINIFWKDLYQPENLKKLPCPLHNPDYTIVLICYVGHTASQTLVLLRLLGFKVVALKFGMGISPVKEVPIRGWLDYHYPLEYGEKFSRFSHDPLCDY
jgi:rhodanese-related sulfurtransferase